MKSPTIALLTCILILISLPKATFCDHVLPQVEWVWSQKDMHILEPEFSKDNKEIAFVRKKLWRLEYERKRRTEPRIADPEVVVVRIGNSSIERVGWGWAPCFSPDGKRIVYVYQKRPISGFRVLAKTLRDNEIVLYDRLTKKSLTLASPSKGYLEYPKFSPNGSHIIFSLWYPEGPVGVGIVSLKSRKQKILISPENPPGVYHCISSPMWINGKVIAIGEKFTPSGVSFDLLDLTKEIGVIYTWRKWSGDRYPSREHPIVGCTQKGNVLLFDEGWFEIDVNTKAAAQRFGGKDLHRESLFREHCSISPNGKMIVYSNCCELWVDEIGHPKPRLTWKTEGWIRFITWSNDSNKLALVVRHHKETDTPTVDFEELVILRVK